MQVGLELGRGIAAQELHAFHAVGLGAALIDCSISLSAHWWRRSACRNCDAARRARTIGVELVAALDAGARAIRLPLG